MKKIIIITLFFILSFQGHAQNWVITNDIINGLEFSTPIAPVFYDTLNTSLYTVTLDSLLALQVHIFTDAQFNVSDTIFNEVLRQEENDTLRAIAKMILLVTNSEATEVQSVSTDSINGLEIGISYKTLASNTPFFSFIQYYLHNSKFISFSATGAERDIERLVLTKNYFFESIKIE